MTGRLNSPHPSFGVVPSCEWINDDGDRLWLPGQFVDLAVVVDARRESLCVVMMKNTGQFLKNARPRLGERLFTATIFCVQLAADTGI